MNIDTARKLDYYIGLPLCFLGTLVAKAAKLISFKTPLRGPKNILFIELSEMGSVILADPAIQKLKRSLDVNIFFAVFRKNSPSLHLLNTVPPENVFIMSDSGISDIAAGAVKFLFWTKKHHIDTVIDLELFSRFTALLSGFSGASRTVGFHAFYNEGLYRGDLHTHKVAYNPHIHIAKNFVALVNALLSDKPEMPYSKTVISDDEISLRKCVVDEGSKIVIRQKIKEEYKDFNPQRHRVILFNTNASDLVPLRRWPEENYILLARIILERFPETLILLTGDSSERAGTEHIAAAVKNRRCLNFAGRTAITDLPALYSVSTLMLTNDSGPAHFASVTDMPVYVFFGPETPALYGPLGRATPIYAGLACSPCITALNHRKSPCNDNICLKLITPEEVFTVLAKALET